MKIQKFVFFIMAFFSLNTLQANACNPCVSCESACDTCDGWSLQADWLFWHARKCDLDYLWPSDVDRYDISCGDGNIANTGNTVTQPALIDGSVITLGKGKPKDIDLDYDHGFRIGVFKDSDDWVAGFRYTYYRTDESDSFTVGSTPYTPSRMHPDIKGFVDRTNISYGKSEYDLDLSLFELQLGHSWIWSCQNSVTLFGGVKAAFIDQDLDTAYHGLSINTSEQNGNYVLNDPDVRIHTVKERVDMDAYGLYLGGEGFWNYCQGFGFFGRASAATLLAKFDRSFYEVERSDPNNNDSGFERVLLVDVKDDDHCIVCHCEFAAGLGYDFCDFGCGDWSLQLGYEFHLWTNMKNFMQFVDHHEKGAIARTNEGLGFDGLFVRLNIGF